MTTLVASYRRYHRAGKRLHLGGDAAKVALFMELRRRYDEDTVVNLWGHIERKLDEIKAEA